MAYEQFASLYDQFMAHAPYDDWVNFTEEIIQNHQLTDHTILDLGCGTGEITLRLKALGYDMTGVDISEDMLIRANEKAIERGSNIQWVKQDIRFLEGFQAMDLCISYCDVINYITNKKDLAQVFQHVFNSLSDSGAFIFDVHHIPYVKNHLANHSFSDVTDNLAYIWECESGDHEGEMYHFLSFFKKQTDGSYERFDEDHHQRTYETATYEILLKNAGFTKITFYSDFKIENRSLNENMERIFIIAEK